MPKLSQDQLNALLPVLDGWKQQDTEISKEWTFDGFPAAIAFVNRVAGLADTADHHPDIDIRYDTVRLVLSTHSEGGLTQADIDLALAIDA